MNDQLLRGINDLAELRRFSGAPKEFWQRFVICASSLVGAETVVLLLGNPGANPRWRKIGEAPAGGSRSAEFVAQLEANAERCLRDGGFCQPLEASFFVAVRLKLLRPEDEVILIALVSGECDSAGREAFVRLNLVADTPQLYLNGLAGLQARHDVEKFAAVLDLLVPLNLEKRFLAAAFALCNGIASRFRCDRVSLGWTELGYLRLRAISRTEKFDRLMVAAQALEAAMEECADQDEEIVWPPLEGSTAVTRDHEKFAKGQSVGHLCSLPLRMDDKAVAVLTCERQESPFASVELQQLRLCCDQVIRQLDDLHRQDRWFGARMAAAVRNQAARFLRPERTWTKLAAILVALSFVALFVIRPTYRVEGSFILRSDEVSYLTAPFDGYIQEVAVRPGDHVAKGGKLLGLNPGELLLEESAALAEFTRYQRETEKARATKALGEMRIAEALAEQARARLGLVRYRLENAVVKSPFDGVVIEGDLRERIAAPVKQGDALFKVARTDTLYVEAEVNERDVKEILRSIHGEIAFVTQPKTTFPVNVIMIEPAAVPKKDGNVFLVRLRFDKGAESWWRPGMTGLCKIAVEKRTLFWILTHRTSDFLRLKLWW